MDIDKHIIAIRLLIIKGLPYTLKLSLTALLFSFIFGIIVGFIRSRRIPVVDQILSAYIGFMRGTPFLILLLLVFFGLPVRNIFISSTVTLTLFNTAYVAEIIRGGIIGISAGQFSAGKSLSMNTFEIMWHIILPQVLYQTMPALIGQLILLIKSTAMCSAIGYVEITRMGTQIMETYGNPHIIFIYIMLLYFILCHTLSTAARFFEKKGKMKMIGQF